MEFYTDPQVMDDFKQVISFLLNRSNTYTGVRYTEDKAIPSHPMYRKQTQSLRKSHRIRS